MPSLGPAAAGEAEKRPVPVYTNEDLERVSPFRDETGAASVPAARPAAPPAATPAKGREQGEAYWRREADRLRERLLPMQDRIEDLRQRIEERRRKPNVLPYSDPQIESWQAQLRKWEERVHDAEDRFLERARRAGALPGWLR